MGRLQNTIQLAAPFALEIVWQLVSARFSIVIINLRLISLRSLTFTTRVFTLLWDRSITMTRQIARKSNREHSSKPNAAAESKAPLLYLIHLEFKNAVLTAPSETSADLESINYAANQIEK